MDTPIKEIMYLSSQVDGIAHSLSQRGTDVRMRQIQPEASENETWSRLANALGYQASARTETRQPWFPDANLISRSPNLLAVCSFGAGYDVIDVDACTEAGIIVCNQSGANSEAVAEHTLGFMLNLSKKMTMLDRLMRSLPDINRFDYPGIDLLGKTVGIVGIGKIGSRVAELCANLFKMTVLAYDPYLTQDEIAARNAAKTELNELLARSDFVSLHCPSTKETQGLMKREQFSLMKTSAYFVNTSRGGTYDENDLVAALKDQTIAGAALDVFVQEPPPLDHPLMTLNNVILSPHNAGLTTDAMTNISTFAADQWLDVFDGKVPPRLINRAVWPKYTQRFERAMGFKPAPLA